MSVAGGERGGLGRCDVKRMGLESTNGTLLGKGKM